MISGALLFGFVTTALIVLLVPGPGVMYVVGRSLGQGYLAGFVSALGLSVGVLVYVAASVVGLSALLLTSATAFGIVKAMGAGYLIYLGLQTIFSNRPSSGPGTTDRLPLFRLFRDGVVVSVFNPKIAVFFLAFLPQFVDPTLGTAPQQFIILGVIYAALALITDSTYALLAGGMRQWFEGAVMQGPLPRYLSGGILLGLGVKTALTSQRQ